MYRIYSLKESFSDEVKYIGLTKQDIKDRLSQHIYKARGAKKKNKVQAWIISCLNSGNNIEINILEDDIIDIKTAIIRESYFIKTWPSIRRIVAET